MGVIVSEEAQEDVIAIWDRISEDNPGAADAFIDHIDARFEMLARNPHAGRQRDELGYGIRSVVLGDYVIFYRITTPDITIMRVVHGARDIPTLFDPSSRN